MPPRPVPQVAKALLGGIERGDYHLPSPDLGQNLLVSAMTGLRYRTALQLGEQGLVLGVVQAGSRRVGRGTCDPLHSRSVLSCLPLPCPAAPSASGCRCKCCWGLSCRSPPRCLDGSATERRGGTTRRTACRHAPRADAVPWSHHFYLSCPTCLMSALIACFIDPFSCCHHKSASKQQQATGTAMAAVHSGAQQTFSLVGLQLSGSSILVCGPQSAFCMAPMAAQSVQSVVGHCARPQQQVRSALQAFTEATR